MKVLREQVAARGQSAVERELGMTRGGLSHALAGGGLYPTTIAKIATLTNPVLTPPPARDLTKVGAALKELGAATSLVLEVLSGVEPVNRARVLDMARAAL